MLLTLLSSIYAKALHRRTLVYSALFSALVLFLLSPLTRSLPYRVFLAALTQELIISEVNPHREALGDVPLQIDPLLQEAARLKAEDMLARGYFSHTGPDGERPWVWLERVGYNYAGAGENLAIDFSDTSALVRAWLNSPSHAANIENGYFTDIGIGIARGTFEGRTTNIVVMFLGRKLGTPLAATTQPPTPTATPAPAPTPVPVPTPTPAPTPTVSVPLALVQEETLATPEISDIAPETPIEPKEPTPEPKEPLLTGAAERPEPLQAPDVLTPTSARIFGFVAENAAPFLRLMLTAFFLSVLAATAVMELMPSQRKLVRPLPIAFLLSLLILIWLPEVV